MSSHLLPVPSMGQATQRPVGQEPGGVHRVGLPEGTGQNRDLLWRWRREGPSQGGTCVWQELGRWQARIWTQQSREVGMTPTLQMRTPCLRMVKNLPKLRCGE